MVEWCEKMHSSGANGKEKKTRRQPANPGSLGQVSALTDEPVQYAVYGKCATKADAQCDKLATELS